MPKNGKKKGGVFSTSAPATGGKQKKKGGGGTAVAGQPASMAKRGASLATGVVRNGGLLMLKFDRAPAHDEYPEGGLRVAGSLPGSTSTGVVTNDTVQLGGWTTAGLASSVVSPSGGKTSNSAQLFAATSAIAVFSQFFRQYRFRMLWAEYNSLISPADTTFSAKQVQLAYERDPVTADGLSATYTIDTAVTSTQCHRFAAWEPEVMVPIITSGPPARDDKLFYVTLADDQIATTSDAELRQTFQGAVTSTISSVAGADQSLGKVIWHFIIDLYGFTNVAVQGVPMRRVPRLLAADARAACSSTATPGDDEKPGPKPASTSRGALSGEIQALRDRLLALETAERSA